jgi:hypothetical protein
MLRLFPKYSRRVPNYRNPAVLMLRNNIFEAFFGLTFWHQRFTLNSNKSPTRCNNFPVYYLDVCLQLNMFRAFSCPSSGAQ